MPDGRNLVAFCPRCDRRAGWSSYGPGCSERTIADSMERWTSFGLRVVRLDDPEFDRLLETTDRCCCTDEEQPCPSPT